MNVFECIVFQVAIFIGLIYLVGFIISLINRTFYRLTGGGMGVCLATGVIGTPIHEISHATMCLVFFHRIEEIKLFQINDENGVLGYVNHSYNRKNLYQVIGNYFIGVAPIVVGALILYLLFSALLPNSASVFQKDLDAFIFLQGGKLNDKTVGYLISVAKGFLSAVFTVDFGFTTIVFLIVCLCVSMHMNLSGADIKGSLGALPLLIILLVVFNYAFWLISATAYSTFFEGVAVVSCYLLVLLFLSLLFSLMILAIGGIVALIKKLTAR